MASASFKRLRLELLKSAARLTVRKSFVTLHLSADHPQRRLWRELAVECAELRAASA